MGMLTKEDSEAKKIQWNENPSVNDYLGITNHGKINDDVFPWKDIIIRIKGGDSSPLTNYQRLRLTKSYREIYKFIEYYHIKSYVSEEVLETYHPKGSDESFDYEDDEEDTTNNGVNIKFDD